MRNNRISLYIDLLFCLVYTIGYYAPACRSLDYD